MGKGSKQRPQSVSNGVMEKNWEQAFEKNHKCLLCGWYGATPIIIGRYVRCPDCGYVLTTTEEDDLEARK